MEPGTLLLGGGPATEEATALPRPAPAPAQARPAAAKPTPTRSGSGGLIAPNSIPLPALEHGDSAKHLDAMRKAFASRGIEFDEDELKRLYGGLRMRQEVDNLKAHTRATNAMLTKYAAESMKLATLEDRLRAKKELGVREMEAGKTLKKSGKFTQLNPLTGEVLPTPYAESYHQSVKGGEDYLKARKQRLSELANEIRQVPGMQFDLEHMTPLRLQLLRYGHGLHATAEDEMDQEHADALARQEEEDQLPDIFMAEK